MPRPEENAIHFPSGDHAGPVIAAGPGCQRLRAPRSDIERPDIRIATAPRADKHELLAIG